MGGLWCPKRGHREPQPQEMAFAQEEEEKEVEVLAQYICRALAEGPLSLHTWPWHSCHQPSSSGGCSGVPGVGSARNTPPQARAPATCSRRKVLQEHIRSCCRAKTAPWLPAKPPCAGWTHHNHSRNFPALTAGGRSRFLPAPGHSWKNTDGKWGSGLQGRDEHPLGRAGGPGIPAKSIPVPLGAGSSQRWLGNAG